MARNGRINYLSKKIKGDYRKTNQTFPVILDITDSYDEVAVKDNSVLRCTLPDLFRITENQLDLVWSAFESKCFGELNIKNTLWKTLPQLFIFQKDPLDILLSLSVSTLVDGFNTREILENLLYEFTYQAEKVLNIPLELRDESSFDDSAILSGLRIDVITNIHLCVFNIPKHLSKPLLQARYKFWGDLAKLSEKRIISELGINADSLLLIKSLWNIRPWAKSATD